MYYAESDSGETFVKAKGMSNLRDFMSFDKMIDTRKHKYVKYTKFKEAIRRGISFNKKIDINKTVNLEDDKRLWMGEFKKEKKEKSYPVRIVEL